MATTRAVAIESNGVTLDGDLVVPDDATGVVLFAHGSGSSRHSSRNKFVAGKLQEGKLATLLLDLLSPGEEVIDARTRHLRFDIPMLAARLVEATDWLAHEASTAGLPIGYFGASTGGGAALVAAAERTEVVRAVVSRGGRPDLAGSALQWVRAPTLLIVGSDDIPVIAMNKDAAARITGAEVVLEVVVGASHLFEEPGTLETVADVARDWFLQHLAASAARAEG